MNNTDRKYSLLAIVGFAILVAIISIGRWYIERIKLKERRAHPAWAVGYFDRISSDNESREAEFHFVVDGRSHRISIPASKVEDSLKANTERTCFPVVFWSLDANNNEVLVDAGDWKELGLTPPDSILDLVRKASTKRAFDIFAATQPTLYPIRLKNDYTLLMEYDNSTEHLDLYGPRDTLIRSRLAVKGLGTPYAILGDTLGDFNNAFVIAHVYDAQDGYPRRTIQLFDKRTGASLLEDSACWIGADRREYYPYPPGMTLSNTVRLVSVDSSTVRFTCKQLNREDMYLEYPRVGNKVLPRSVKPKRTI